MHLGRSLLLALCLALGLPAASRAGALEDGQSAYDRGDLPAALVAWSQALHQARSGEDATATVDLGLRVAAVLRQLGKLDEAEALLTTLAPSAESLEPAAQRRVALARAQVGIARGRTAQEEKALARLFSEAQSAGDPVGAANIAVNLGLARHGSGDLEGAARAYAGAATLFTALEDPAGQATALTDASIVLRQQGSVPESLSRAEEAVTAARAARSPVLEADAQAALAAVQLALGRDEVARELFESALAVARGRRDSVRQAHLLMSLGTIDLSQGDPLRASARFRAAEEVLRQHGDLRGALQAAQARALASGDSELLEGLLGESRQTRDRGLQAQLLLNLAGLARTEGDLPAAGRHAAEAVKLGERLGLREVRWRAHATLGLLAWQRQDLEVAGRELEAAVAELEATRHGLGADTGRAWVLGHREVYEALVDVRLLQGDTTGAFVIAQQLQLAELSDAPVPASDDPALEAFRRLQAREAWLEKALTEEARAGESEERSVALKAELAELRVAFARTVDQLRASNPDFDALVRVEPEDLEAVQADLDGGVLVLQPVALEDRLVLLTARRDGLGVHEVAVPRAELDAAVEELGLMMAFPRMFKQEDVEAAATRLGSWLLAPVADELAETDVLVLAPSGSLRALPLALLRHQGKPIIATHAVARVTHVGSLRRHGAAEAPLRLDGGGLLLVGNPDGSLPGAEAEVRAIGDRLPGATALIGSAATRAAIIERLPGKRAVHLATHGVVDMRQPDRSHLVLAPDPSSGAGDSGHLGYPEIPGLAPYLEGVRLVVLSACESARPVDKPKGGEGEPVVSIQGLSAQFRRAGVETLVATLWKVDDTATQRLMGRFYDELAAGTDPARALQRAQLELSEDPELSHPFYWGAFVVAGDWR